MENIIKAVLQYENRPVFVTNYDSAKRHVEKWLNQFEVKYRDAIVVTMDSIFENSFITKDDFKSMCTSKVQDEFLTYKNPQDYWLKTYILDCQKNGKSQSEMVKILNSSLLEKGISSCKDIDKAERLLYLDDMAFTFGRIRTDIKKYEGRNIDILPIISHSYNDYYFKAHEGNFKTIRTMHCIMLENRLACKNRSQVFWPHVDCLQNNAFKKYFDYFNCKNEYLRDVDYTYDVFKDALARKLCEEAFFIEGAKIIMSLDDKKNFKPLGIFPYDGSWGFGGTIFSYRNCPNATPLVIWWGDYYDSRNLCYPLMLRKGYNQ